MREISWCRRLPKLVLLVRSDKNTGLELKLIEKAFSDPSHCLGEREIDYIAMLYLSDKAKAFWLPRFLSYLMTAAPRDSLHYELILRRLSDAKFVNPLIKILSDVEISDVTYYLNWFRSQPGELVLDKDLSQWCHAQTLWTVKAAK